jgi:hypothetical protein
MPSETSKACLNCSAELRGRFCSACGQRDVLPAPTLRELIDEGWQELTVFDKRLLGTLGLLLRRPGALTREVLAGRRARYVRPVRLYLIVSVGYFLISALVPLSPTTRTTATLPGKEEIKIDILDPRQLSPEQQEKALRNADRAPRLVRPLFRRLVLDPAGFRRNMTELLPRLVFVLVPVFSVIVAIFFRRPFSHHLVFALHLFAAVFAVMTVRRLVNLSGSVPFIAVAEGLAVLFIAVYSLRAFRSTYGETWLLTILKSFGVAILYLVTGIVALTITAILAASQA